MDKPIKIHDSRDFGFSTQFTIYTGNCPSREAGDSSHDATRVSSWLGYAHTHNCKNDPYYLSVCIEFEEYLTDFDGTASQILKHEYAHVLDAKQHEFLFTNVKCSDNLKHSYDIPDDPEMEKLIKDYEQDDHHGSNWQRIMTEIGLAPSKYVSLPKRSFFG